MSLTVDVVESLAPDQASLKAASKLMKPGKWPLLNTDKDGGGLIWGECQGSGANPYRVVVDSVDHGYKCTCPSRKFPCKHALALMWIFAETPEGFSSGSVPEWATEWVSRRRKTSDKEESTSTSIGKNISLATAVEPEKPVDPKAEARKKAAAEKRAAQTQESIYAATEELEDWMNDQLQLGLDNLQKELTDRCRKIAARLVDGKAAALAGRIDELPSRVLDLPTSIQVDALIAELGQLKLLTHAWRINPQDPELKRLISTSENRQSIIDDPLALRFTDQWEVLGELIRTRRDGLVEQATWLLRLSENSEAPRFALLLDFFPSSGGKRSNSHTSGEQFQAELAFYPGKNLQRAVIVSRKESETTMKGWGAAENALEVYRAYMKTTPWAYYCPVLLGPGKIAKVGKSQAWWYDDNGELPPLMIEVDYDDLIYGLKYESAAGLWNGYRLQLISAHSHLGRINFVS